MNVEKTRLVAVRLTPEQFRTLSEDERELLIGVGLGYNKVLLFQWLWGALYYRAGAQTEAYQAQAAVQGVAFLLVLIGSQPQPGFRRTERRSETGRGEALAGELYAL
jgi:hypothetical protein